jgi:hypothetical protein
MSPKLCLGDIIKDYIINHVCKIEQRPGCPIFPSILIAKYLFTGSLKNRSIDNLETQKKYISMKNSQFFNYLPICYGCSVHFTYCMPLFRLEFRRKRFFIRILFQVYFDFAE